MKASSFHSGHTSGIRPRRADTRRNHERILAAAAESLSRSAELSFNAIAKQAQVGVGTVYRHFPTPDGLTPETVLQGAGRAALPQPRRRGAAKSVTW